MNKVKNKWRLIFLLSLLFWVPITIYLMSIVLDQGISITYMSQGYEDTEADLERLAKLYPKSAHSKKDILYLLRKQNPDGFIVETQCTIQIHGLRFEFNNKGKLLNITVQAESKPEYDCKNT